MKTKTTFDLKNDWNYLPSTKKAIEDGRKEIRPEFEGLKYDDLRGLSWTILEECD